MKEVEVHSDRYGYAGRFDLVCEINGKIWLIDFKTGKDIYPESSLQLVAYKTAIEEQGIMHVDKTGVVLATEEGEYMFKETKGKIEDFLNVMEVWKWIQRRA